MFFSEMEGATGLFGPCEPPTGFLGCGNLYRLLAQYLFLEQLGTAWHYVLQCVPQAQQHMQKKYKKRFILHLNLYVFFLIDVANSPSCTSQEQSDRHDLGILV